METQQILSLQSGDRYPYGLRCVRLVVKSLAFQAGRRRFESGTHYGTVEQMACSPDCKSGVFGYCGFESYLSHATQERASATTMTLTGVADPTAYALAA